ncbi:MAG: hypothetical protein WBG67_21355, partial [Thermoanaerobaculia bacterium]
MGKWTLPQLATREQSVQTGGSNNRTDPRSRYQPQRPRPTGRERNSEKMESRSSERQVLRIRLSF